MVKLIDETGGKTNLVTIGAITIRRGRHELPLRELTFERILNRHGRIAGTGHTHRMVNIGSAGQRITDRTADTGRCTTEGLNLCRVVVGFILEKKKPLLVFTVNLDIDLHGAGIDFL